MAALTGPTILASGGGQGQPRWAVLAFPKVSAADTFDASTLTTIPAFAVIWAAMFVATSNRTETFAIATLAGTVITVVGTGVAADAGMLFVLGE